MRHVLKIGLVLAVFAVMGVGCAADADEQPPPDSPPPGLTPPPPDPNMPMEPPPTRDPNATPTVSVGGKTFGLPKEATMHTVITEGPLGIVTGVRVGNSFVEWSENGERLDSRIEPQDEAVLGPVRDALTTGRSPQN
jgi:hypothetical protein